MSNSPTTDCIVEGGVYSGVYSNAKFCLIFEVLNRRHGEGGGGAITSIDPIN